MEEAEEVVADASVIPKWFIEEEYSDKSLELRDDYVARLVDISCPDLLPYEVINALGYNPQFSEGEVKESAEALKAYSLYLYPIFEELAERGIEYALRYGLSIYDAAYIALGEERGVKVYTADEKLVQKTAALGWILHIKNYAKRSA